MNNTQSIPAANPLLLRLVTGIAALALLAGCASTGEKVSQQSGTASIQTLGVAIVVRNNLEVKNAAENSTFLPAFLLGLLGDEIQQGARWGRDAKTAEPMRPHMSAEDYRQRAEAKLAEVLRQSGKFQSVQITGVTSRNRTSLARRR